MLSFHASLHPNFFSNDTKIKIPSLYRDKPLICCNVSSNRIIKNPIVDFSACRSSINKFRLAAALNSVVDSKEGTKSAERELPEGLKAELMPKHIAVIMDGNRRWAKNKGFPVQLGHRALTQSLFNLTRACSKLGVQVVSFFAFSTENWNRVDEEVDFLMRLYEEVIRLDIQHLIRTHGIKLSVMGDISRLPPSFQSAISLAEEQSKGNKGVRLVMALSYSGTYDITQACKQISRKVKDGVLGVDDVNDAVFEQHLLTNGFEFPNVDLLIRPSGEVRISNFMLWQTAYAEFVFVNKLFPDFGEEDLIDAIREFQKRQRRFGGHTY